LANILSALTAKINAQPRTNSTPLWAGGRRFEPTGGSRNLFEQAAAVNHSNHPIRRPQNAKPYFLCFFHKFVNVTINICTLTNAVQAKSG
jgi:hypothetical protein